MPDLKEINCLQRVVFEIQQIRKRLDTLEDFISAEIKDDHREKPSNKVLIDPRSGREFKKQKGI
jgi:hypothetical protein